MGEADRLLGALARLQGALATARGRIADFKMVVAGVDAEALAERARRDPSDWPTRLAAGIAIVAAQPKLARVVEAGDRLSAAPRLVAPP